MRLQAGTTFTSVTIQYYVASTDLTQTTGHVSQQTRYVCQRLMMSDMSMASLPWVSQSRRWLGRSPHGSSGRGGRTCIQHQTVSRCLSETHDTLPGSAIWCPVPWSCWQPSQTNTEQRWGGRLTENCLMSASVTNSDARGKKSPIKHGGNRSKNIFSVSSAQIGS